MSAAIPNPSASPPPSAPAPGTTAGIPELELTTAEQDGRFHNYVGHAIPWYVRLIWILFWCYSAWYVIKLLLPALDVELLSPP